MNKKAFLLSLFFLGASIASSSQVIKGTLKGEILDANSKSPLPYATIRVSGIDWTLGTYSNENGFFILEQVPVGRHQVNVSLLGYDTIIVNDVLVSTRYNSGLRIQLTERVYGLDEVVIRPKQAKERPLNEMATVSARQLNMEEANRFAGAFDDPARLVTSFAGVASGSGDSNAFSVRGNSPKGTLWQMEGIPVPNPNHFAEIVGFGGGGITALSSKTIGNSDFFMGAFPAEYGNALSSVFDLSLRKGDYQDHHHSFQVGFFGLDAASEGPLFSSSPSSYLFNYRYSTLGLFGLGLTYQDLSFKLHVPTQKAGSISIWGLGLTDESKSSPDPDTMDTEAKWQYYDDISTEHTELTTGILGVTHKISLNNKSALKTTGTVSVNKTYARNSRLDPTFTQNTPLDEISYTATDYRLSSVLNSKLGAQHSNRTGLLFTRLTYDFNLQNALFFGDSLTTFADDRGSSQLFQAYTQSSFRLGRFRLNPGLHLLYFDLNRNYALEPRLGVEYALNDRIRISLGYGLHSQVEKLSFYLADIPTNSGSQQLNTDLGLGKAHHIVWAYDQMFGDYTHLRIEPYYQYLFNIPVVANSYFSMLNLNDDFFLNEALVNEGTGENYGLDLTLERFLHQGLYYISTLSLFNSEYTDGWGTLRPTRFNRKIVGNFLIGKEWLVKDKNLWNANVKYTYLGGTWAHPIDKEASLASAEIVEDLSRAFSIQNPTSHVVSFTITYRVNKKNYSSLWSLQILNVSGAKEHLGYQYNFRMKRLEENTDVIVLPNLSYRIEF